MKTSSFRGVLTLGIVVALAVMAGRMVRAEETETETGAATPVLPPASAAQQVILKASDLERIQQRLDEIAENHEKIVKAIEDIKIELAAAKIRVTN